MMREYIDTETAVKMLREPLRYEFIGKETDFEENIFENLSEIVKNL